MCAVPYSSAHPDAQAQRPFFDISTGAHVREGAATQVQLRKRARIPIHATLTVRTFTRVYLYLSLAQSVSGVVLMADHGDGGVRRGRDRARFFWFKARSYSAAGPRYSRARFAGAGSSLALVRRLTMGNRDVGGDGGGGAIRASVSRGSQIYTAPCPV